ncbi:hypothetical protein ACO2JO_15180 [Leptospira interrogans]
MPTEKQIAANRANGRRSRGPTSLHGKARAGRNSYRHGLTGRDSSAGFLLQVEKLAHRLAGNNQSAIVHKFARVVAEADLELARVRRVKAALIERASALGGLVPPKHFRSMMQEVRWCQAMDLWFRGLRPCRPPQPAPINPLASMPVAAPGRSAEACCRMLTELIRLDRYANRAFTRRDRAIRELVKAMTG